jgi:diguanylate cyclase (GGDEF)-like protein/PAS domain S-box-containing protein
MIDLAFDSLGDAIIVFDRDARIVTANRSAVAMTAISIEEAEGRSLTELAASIERLRERHAFFALVEATITEIIASGSSLRDDDASRITIDGDLVPTSLHLYPVRGRESDHVVGAVMVIRDHLLASSLSFRRASVGMAHIDRAGNIREANDALLSLLGRDHISLRAQPFVSIVHPDDARLVETTLHDVLAQETEAPHFEARFLHADGSTRWIDLNLAANGLGTEQLAGAVAILQDVTQRVQLAVELSAAHERLRELAVRDPLTGLANRAGLADDLEGAQLRAADAGKHVAVLYVDLDGFKQVNDTDGHRAGDQLLVEVGGRLVNLLRPHDTAARVGGDEFVVCCGDLDPDPEIAQREAEAIATRVSTALTAPFEVHGSTWQLGASVGIALSLAGEERPDALLESADLDMYRAKRQ